MHDPPSFPLSLLELCIFGENVLAGVPEWNFEYIVYMWYSPFPQWELKETHIILQEKFIFTYFIFGEHAFRRWERRGVLSFVKLTRKSAVLGEIKFL